MRSRILVTTDSGTRLYSPTFPTDTLFDMLDYIMNECPALTLVSVETNV